MRFRHRIRRHTRIIANRLFSVFHRSHLLIDPSCHHLLTNKKFPHLTSRGWCRDSIYFECCTLYAGVHGTGPPGAPSPPPHSPCPLPQVLTEIQRLLIPRQMGAYCVTCVCIMYGRRITVLKEGIHFVAFLHRHNISRFAPLEYYVVCRSTTSIIFGVVDQPHEWNGLI